MKPTFPEAGWRIKTAEPLLSITISSPDSATAMPFGPRSLFPPNYWRKYFSFGFSELKSDVIFQLNSNLA